MLSKMLKYIKSYPFFRSGIKKSHIYGFFYGFTQGLMFFVMAAAFGFGAFLVNRGEMDLASVYKYAMFCL